MKISRESIIHNQSPEYRHALQELIKFELQALVERLSATGEEALILTASCQDGSSTQFGSQKAEEFLKQQSSLAKEFLSFCHDDTAASSGDELCNSGDELEDNDGKEDPISQPVSTNLQYSPIRQRERTSSKRLSFTEKETTGGIYEAAQNSDLSASERNDSASSVASFVEAQEDSQTSGNKNSLQCNICSRTFRSYKALNQHSRLHMSQSYKCNTCGKIFTLKKSYLRHIKSHKFQKANKLFECGLCDKSFRTLSSWKRHRMCHLDVRRYSCNLCGKAFFEKYSLRVHQTSHFYSSVRNTDIASKFSCHICGKVLKSRNAVKAHMLTHSAKKFTCEFCNKRFSQKYSCVRHRRIHTGEKPYKCGECKKSFSDGSAWSKHIRTHTGIKPYSCDVCSKSFYDKTRCKTHMETHKGKNLYNKAVEENERNFKILSEDLQPTDEHYEGSRSDLDFGMGKARALYNNHLDLHLDVSDKESEDSQLLDTGLSAELLPSKDEKKYPSKDKSPDKKVTSIMESIVLDEKFQSDFVERNMPSKPIESDNELISTAFPEDSDILGEDTEAEMQPSIHDDEPYTGSKQDAKMTQQETQNEGWQKKGAQRRSVRGKVFPESPAKCMICHKKFKQESLLKQHLQFHCMSKLYKCRYCGKQLSSKHSLIRHERIHVGERPYQCYMCQKTFADNYGCIRHINTHFNKDIRGSGKPSKSTYKSSQEHYNYESSPKYLSSNRDYESPTSAESYASPKSVERPSCTKSETETYSGSVCANSLYNPSPRFSLEKATIPQELVAKPTVDISVEKAKDNVPPVVNTTVAAKQHLYKCFKCSQLFITEKLCIDHITQTCSKLALTASEFVVTQTSTGQNSGHQLTKDNVQPPSKNLFQCSLCLLMFEDKSACEQHIANKCEKSKSDAESAVQSILEEPFIDSEFGSLPKLPFPEVSTENSYLDMSETQVLLIPDSLPTSTVTHTASAKPPETSQSAGCILTSKSSGPLSFIPLTNIASQCSTAVKFTSGVQSTVHLPSDSQFTALLQKPVVNVGSSKFIIANQGINFVGPSSTEPVKKSAGQGKKKNGEKSSEDDLKERTCDICNKVFTTKYILKQHSLKHMERKFGCKYCMKKFHNKYGRDRHERIHTGEKPYSCPYCKVSFGEHSTFRKHTRNCAAGK